MDIDPAQAGASRAVARQDAAQRVIAPGRHAAAIEHAVRIVVLARADGGLIPADAALGDRAGQRGLVLLRRRPVRRQQQRRDLGIGGVLRQRPREIHEVAVQVDVVLVDPAHVREAVGVDRMDQQQRRAGLRALLQQRRIVQQRDLRAGAAEALGAVHRRGDEDQMARIARADPGHVHRQLLVLGAAPRRMRERRRHVADVLGGKPELRAGFLVAA